jgi:MSHA pilin protein MshD
MSTDAIDATGARGAAWRAQGGASMIELVIFIVIVGVAVAGVLSIMTITSKSSADPMLRKQALAIAESLLEEIELMPLTYCDPNDANAGTATAAVVGPSGCATTVQGLAPSAGETRYADPRFDNVGDYNGFSMTPIRDLQNSAVAGLGNYSASVTIVQDGVAFSLAAGAVLRIDVHVTGGPSDFVMSGYRFRYAPTALP